MIIKEISQVDRFAEQMMQNAPFLIPVDIRDYNSIKNCSATLNAACIKLPIHIKRNDISSFIETINSISNENAHRLLLQICNVGSNPEAHSITVDDMNDILRGIDEHFGDIDIVWGLSTRTDCETCGYEINVIVGYK